MAKAEVDSMPAIVAGIETVKCQCGWESALIMPEENHLLTIKVLEHIQQHGIDIPQFNIQMH